MRFWHLPKGSGVTIEQFGQRIRGRRKSLGLTQRDLAELAVVNLRGLIRLEKGDGNPTFDLLAKLADALGLELTLVPRSTDASS